ncbi:MAG: alpha/beta fold hydrolase [Minisyncoccia bacterium]|jgi:pimeloyl-ACP methyl ester carboxylesterase
MEKRCLPVTIVTPKKYLLNGLWFGGDRPRSAIVFVHGLSPSSSVFSHQNFLVPLASEDTAVIFFNNRGHDKVTRIRKKSGQGETAGGAHEVFTECADDLEGVVRLLRRKKVKEIYLVGHSTGSQKIAYYLSRNNNQRRIAGAALLVPISDYASNKKFAEPRKFRRAHAYAAKLVAQKRPHELLPASVWPDLVDAQRFLSLNTPNSKEEIFSYAQPRKIPRTLRKIKIPLLVVFAGNDEYADRPAREMAEWFGKNIKSKRSKIIIVPRARHGFREKEERVASLVKKFIATAGR